MRVRERLREREREKKWWQSLTGNKLDSFSRDLMTGKGHSCSKKENGKVSNKN